MKQKKSFVNIYRLVILVISICLGVLVLDYSDDYGGNDGFLGVGAVIGIFLAFLLRVALIKPSNAKIAVNWFLYSIIVIPFFIVLLLVFINRNFDTSRPTAIKVEVIEKDIATTIKKGNKRTSYIIWVKSWKSKREKEILHITQDQYMKLSVGSYVYIKVKKGYLGQEYLYGPANKIIEF